MAASMIGSSAAALSRTSARPLAVSALCAASSSLSRPAKRRCFAVSASRSATELPSTAEAQQAIAKAKAADVVSASQTARECAYWSITCVPHVTFVAKRIGRA